MFKKFLAITLAMVMLFSLAVPAFADGADATSGATAEVADYVEVQLDEVTEDEFTNIDSWGIKWMHVVFKEPIWGLGYYEMGLDYSIWNSHSLVLDNIASIDLGKGVSGADIVIPTEGNEVFNPVKPSLKTVKYGYWFPRTYKVLNLEVSRRRDVKIEPVNEVNYLSEAVQFKVSYADEAADDGHAGYNYLPNIRDLFLNYADSPVAPDFYSYDLESATLTLSADLINTIGDNTLEVVADNYQTKTVQFKVSERVAPILTIVNLNDEGYYVGGDLRLEGDGPAVADYLDNLVEVKVYYDLEGTYVDVGVVDFEIEGDGDTGALVVKYDPDVFNADGYYKLILSAPAYNDAEYMVEYYFEPVEVTFIVEDEYYPNQDVVIGVESSSGSYLSSIDGVEVDYNTANFEVDTENNTLTIYGSAFPQVGEYEVIVYSTNYDPQIVTIVVVEAVEPLGAPQILSVEKKHEDGSWWSSAYDYYEISFENLDGIGEDYLDALTAVYVNDQQYSTSISMGNFDNSYYKSGNLLDLKLEDGFIEGSNVVAGTVLIEAEGYNDFRFIIDENGQLVEDIPELLDPPTLGVIPQDAVLEGQAAVLAVEEDAAMPYLDVVNKVVVNGQETDYTIDDSLHIVIPAEYITVGVNNVVVNAVGYYQNELQFTCVAAEEDDVEAPQYIEIFKKNYGIGFASYDYYELVFEDGDYLAAITEIAVNGTPYEKGSLSWGDNRYDVDDNLLWLKLEDAFTSEGDNVVVISAEGYFDYQFTVNQQAVEQNQLLATPEPNGVALRVLPNAEMPFVGSVTFDGDSDEIDAYLRAIDEVEVSGTEYSKFSITSVLNFENIMEIIGLATAEEFSLPDLIAMLVDVFGEEYAYYTLPELPTMTDVFEKIKELYNTDYSNSLEIASLVTGLLADVGSFMLEDMVALDLTADGFNFPTNTTVTVKADGYRDLTFTFNAIGQIESFGQPEESMAAPTATFVERELLPDYCRLTFDGDELDVADYVAKITTIKVNGEYYAKHSSLLFSKAYMLSKVYGDIFGFYVFVDMTVDGFSETGDTEVLIVAEGFEDLEFIIPAE